MDSKRVGLCFIGLFLLLGITADIARADKPILSTLQVTILDENGSLVHSAHVYIFSQNKKSFFGTREAYGTSRFELPAGNYRIFAALTLKSNGLMDHYSSPEACVHVSAAEPASVILPLQKAPDSEMILSDTARQKLGIDEELSKYLN